MIVKRYPYDRTLACEGKLLGIEPYEDVTLCLDVSKSKGETLFNISLLEETFAIVSVNISTLLAVRHSSKGCETHLNVDLGEKLTIEYVDSFTVQFTMHWDELDDIVFTITANEFNQIVSHFETVANVEHIMAECNKPSTKCVSWLSYYSGMVLNFPREFLEKMVDKFK